MVEHALAIHDVWMFNSQFYTPKWVQVSMHIRHGIWCSCSTWRSIFSGRSYTFMYFWSRSEPHETATSLGIMEKICFLGGENLSLISKAFSDVLRDFGIGTPSLKSTWRCWLPPWDRDYQTLLSQWPTAAPAHGTSRSRLWTGSSHSPKARECWDCWFGSVFF